MKYIKLFEEFKIKPRATDVPVYSTGQRPITSDNKKVTRKQDIIVATDDNIKQIVRDEINRLGTDADLNHINTSQVTDMHCLFMDTDFQGDVSQWDVSNVKDMSYMFIRCYNFNCDLSKWDVSNVTNMYAIFYECSNFNKDISDWDVSKVKDMRDTFNGCTSFNQDISKWDIRSVRKMDSMFERCTNFNQDLSSWDARMVRTRGYMFIDCPIKKEFKPKFK